MIALLQRVNYAKVVVEGKTVGEIDKGILVFLGLERDDNEQLCHKMFDKIVKYRMFYDENGKM
ncbi:MAG: D-aminoacyl-tRNA deacylase, partial [Succinivibrio dextrinosolvens]|nr:D-aminoacyl-tRNA deacylase [Succinivibrio dextrinosolvens]